jgi:hypothetical protein
MATLTQDEKQALVNQAAPRLWALEDLIATLDDPVLTALVDDLHARAATLIVGDGLTVPARVQTRSGGGGK